MKWLHRRKPAGQPEVSKKELDAATDVIRTWAREDRDHRMYMVVAFDSDSRKTLLNAVAGKDGSVDALFRVLLSQPNLCRDHILRVMNEALSLGLDSMHKRRQKAMKKGGRR